MPILEILIKLMAFGLMTSKCQNLTNVKLPVSKIVSQK